MPFELLTEACQVAFVDQARAEKRKVLIHCAAGISRSTTLLLVYLMARLDMSLRDAFLLVKRRRPIVCPNSGFVKQLIHYETRLRGAPSVALPSEISSYITLQDLIRDDLLKQGPLDEDVRDVLSH